MPIKKKVIFECNIISLVWISIFPYQRLTTLIFCTAKVFTCTSFLCAYHAKKKKKKNIIKVEKKKEESERETEYKNQHSKIVICMDDDSLLELRNTMLSSQQQKESKIMRQLTNQISHPPNKMFSEHQLQQSDSFHPLFLHFHYMFFVY